MADIACATCAWWQPPRQTAGQSYGFDSDVAGPRTGQCRRFPPAPILTTEGLRAYWPVTFRDHWCGEHGVVERRDSVNG